MDALVLLARLAGQEVERARVALAAIDARIEARRRGMAGEQSAIEREAGAASGLEGARQLAIWLAANRQRRRLAEQDLERLEGERAAQLARLGEQRLELKRLELLQTRRQQRRQTEERWREQRAADEQALLRAARQSSERTR
jgi:hypothetical protein